MPRVFPSSLSPSLPSCPPSFLPHPPSFPSSFLLQLRSSTLEVKGCDLRTLNLCYHRRAHFLVSVRVFLLYAISVILLPCAGSGDICTLTMDGFWTWILQSLPHYRLQRRMYLVTYWNYSLTHHIQYWIIISCNEYVGNKAHFLLFLSHALC